MKTLEKDELDQLKRFVIMGVSRLLIESGRTKTVVGMLSKYLQPNRDDIFGYFLEPLVALESKGLLEHGPLLEFCTKFRPPCSGTALGWLKTAYKPADDEDKGNFLRLIVEPLHAISTIPNNLMDIRFNSGQRAELVSTIRNSLLEKRRFSLIRLGDGEAYPFPIPPTKGLDRALFENDIRNFENQMWGTSPAPESARADFVKRFLSAVANCDILGVPSVYRIMRNLTAPHTRYGSRRNQRGFMRILNALGSEIPIEQKILTEERCHRIRGAIDASLLFELADIAQSTVIITSRENLKPKFVQNVECILVPDTPRRLFAIYPELIKRVRNVSGPGTIVFVGAGQVAKILVDEARKCGAVALDVGSLMDYMVGLKTRTIADLV
jgi:hypothetical protein